MEHAIAFARDAGPFDAILAVGGGSAIDTAKAVNLLTTNPGELMDYLNAPVGRGQAPTQPLLPLVAVPTTTGTGVGEHHDLRARRAVAAGEDRASATRRCGPRSRSSTPSLTLTQPPMVTAAAGMDILCHALESYTARWYADFDAKQPEQRVPYCGANPIADMWSEKALSLLAGVLPRRGARRRRRRWRASRWRWPRPSPGSASATPACTSRTPTPTRSPAGSATTGPRATPTRPIVPHGMAVSLTAPAAFRFTFDADPERHLRAARLLDPVGRRPGPDALPAVLAALMRDIGMPERPGRGGLRRGRRRRPGRPARMQQQRLLATAPHESHGGGPGVGLPGVDGTLVTCRTPPRTWSPRCGAGASRDVDDSTLTRALYSSDASLYRVVPQVVVRPRHADELQRDPRRLAPRPAPPVTMRGAGTSIAGNAVGPGIVVDTAQAPQPRASRSTPRPAPPVVQPGVVHADLQRAAAPHGLRFGPDPSTHTRCTIGGMIGNNACGSRALGYGRTVDNVLDLDVVYGPGRRSTSTGAARRRWSTSTSAHVRTRSAGSPARSAATRWSTCCPRRPRVDRFLVGSEGTLAVVRGRRCGWSRTTRTGTWWCWATRR